IFRCFRKFMNTCDGIVKRNHFMSLVILEGLSEIAIHLRAKNLKRSFGIGHGIVCIVQHLAGIKTISGGQCSALKFMEDVLNINHILFADVEVDSHTQELFGQQRNIKFVGVISRKVTVKKDLKKLFGLLLKSLFVGNIGIINPVD